MRAALWFMSLFALAVGGAWLVGHNIGTVTLYWPPYRVDVSLNLVLLSLVVVAVALAVVQRAVLALLAMPKQAKQWRQQQKERAAYGALLDALTHFMAGRYVRSRKAAELAVEKEAAYQLEEGARVSHASALRTLAHLTAADAAHALQDSAGREQHAQAAQHAIDLAAPALRQALQEGVDLRAARWALNDRDAEGSLQRLEAMPSALARRVVALRMRLKAARLAGQTGKALDTALLLVKHKAFFCGCGEQPGAQLGAGLVATCARASGCGRHLAQARFGRAPTRRTGGGLCRPLAGLGRRCSCGPAVAGDCLVCLGAKPFTRFACAVGAAGLESGARPDGGCCGGYA